MLESLQTVLIEKKKIYIIKQNLQIMLSHIALEYQNQSYKQS